MLQDSTLKLHGLKMDTAVVQQFLNFFQDFINLCQSKYWPDNDTSENELRNAFVVSQHVEKCLDRLQKKGIINEFLSVLDSHEGTSSVIHKNCLLDPPKYILKKIINSNTKIKQMDIAFRLFLEIFSEDKLENCLTDLMLEAASKETLLNNLSSEIPKDKIIKFKSDILLTELSNSDVDIYILFSNCNTQIVEILVFCLLNSDEKYTKAVKIIADAFLNIVVRKNSVYKTFWRLLFEVDEKFLIQMCLENSDIYICIVEALTDCGKLLQEGMSAESFYIDLNKQELDSIVKRICKNDCLKSQFFDVIHNYDTNVEYWQNIL